MQTLTPVPLHRVVEVRPSWENAQVAKIIEDYGTVEDGDHYFVVELADGKVADVLSDECQEFTGTIGYDWFDGPVADDQKDQMGEDGAHVPWPRVIN